MFKVQHTFIRVNRDFILKYYLFLLLLGRHFIKEYLLSSTSMLETAISYKWIKENTYSHIQVA